MKHKFLFTVFCALIVYITICIFGIVNFNKKVDSINNSAMCVNRAQTVSVFKSNDKVFKRSVEIFEQFYDDIKLNPYSKKYYISDRMYAEDIKNITNDYKLSKGYPAELLQCLKYIFETLKFTDFIIEENHTYQIQQRIMGDDTEVGAIYSPNKLHKYNIEGNWYYHYRRDRYSHENKYVGRWLYDLLYN